MIKTLVEHIRTVHFSLLVLCLVMLSTSPHQKDINQAAFEQAQGVAEYLNQKSLDQLAADYFAGPEFGSRNPSPPVTQQFHFKPGEEVLWYELPANSIQTYEGAWSKLVKRLEA